MKRSVVGPLILIGLGGLFLANNVLPDFRITRLFTTYWPFLLIAWGVLRLLEVLFTWNNTDGRPVSRGLSGGEIFLIVLVCVIGSASLAINKNLPHFKLNTKSVELFGESFEYPVTHTAMLGVKPRIVFDNSRGNIRVNGADGREMKITGHKTIRAFDKDSADRQNTQTPFEVVAEGDRLYVRTNQDRASDNKGMSADLEVTLPKDASVEGRGRYGDFEISDIDGSVEIVSDNTGVRLNRIGGNARVELRRSDIVRAVDMKGSVEVVSKGNGGDLDLQNIAGETKVNGNFSGSLEFRNIAKTFHFESRNTDLTVAKLPGQITMSLGNLTATNLAGPVRMTSRSKDIRIEEFTDSLDLDIERGDVDLVPRKTPLAKVNARTRSGAIEITLPAAGKFDFTATTERGEISNDFGEPMKATQDGRNASLKGKTGAGPTISVSTNRGSITVRKE